MSFLAPIVPYVAPYAGPAGYGAVAGCGIAIADQFKSNEEGAAEGNSNFFSTLARNLIIGALSAPILAIGLPNLTSWVISFIPETTQAAISTFFANGIASATTGFYALPFAAQVGIPIAIVAVVAGAIGIAILLKNRAANPEEPANPPANPPANQEVPQTA